MCLIALGLQLGLLNYSARSLRVSVSIFVTSNPAIEAARPICIKLGNERRLPIEMPYLSQPVADWKTARLPPETILKRGNLAESTTHPQKLPFRDQTAPARIPH
jgi:hypothetical protein